MKKAVYFAAGSPGDAAADLKRLGLLGPETALRVVVPVDSARELGELASLQSEQMLVFRSSAILGLWVRLCMFLGLSYRSEIIFLKSPGRFRSLKLLALMLPGKLVLSDGENQQNPCSHLKLLQSTLVQAIAAEGPVCVVCTASLDRLKTIVPNFRERYPHASVFGAVPASSGDGVAALFDSFILVHPSLIGAYLRLLPRCLGKKRFQEIILPFTNEGYSAFKWLAWLLPLWQIEVYNENLDSFKGRNIVSLYRHLWWRRRQRQVLRRQQREIRAAEREAQRRALPVGVVGSASAFYLKTIVPVVRANFPHAKVHGLLPDALEGAARNFFDSTTILKSGFGALWQCWKNSRMKVQCWIVPCTDEPYPGMKLAAFLFPFGPRHIYNELADGFPARDLGTLYRHVAWRSRDHLSFQILVRTAGGNLWLRIGHLSIYSLRLLMGAAALLKVRLRSMAGRGSGRAGKANFSFHDGPSVDLIYLDSSGMDDRPELPASGASTARMKTALMVSGFSGSGDAVLQINAAIRNSQAQFVCLMDSRCQMLNEDWLDRLLEAFDERTAQVGPELINPANGSVFRGGLIGKEGEPQWNSDNAVCWHGRSDWLLVEAIPWACLVIRRNAFLKAGDFGEDLCRDPIRADMNFCRRLSAQGWISICNRSVTATYPLAAESGDLEPAGAIRASHHAEGRP